jgi:hypothetical protein
MNSRKKYFDNYFVNMWMDGTGKRTHLNKNHLHGNDLVNKKLSWNSTGMRYFLVKKKGCPLKN